MDKNSPRTVQRSIQRSLLLSLMFALGFSVLLLVGAGYYIYSLKIEVEIRHQADVHINSLSGNLEILLWTLDDQAIHNVGAHYESIRDISSLVITNSFGDTVFSFDKQLPDTDILREAKVIYKGDEVGVISLGMSTSFYKTETMEMFWTSLSLALAVGAILLIATNLILKRHLEKPLRHLNELSNSYAAGEFDEKHPQSPSLEFQGVVSALSMMGRTIEGQISDLRDAEAAYRSIFENALEGMVQSKPDGVINKVNPAMAHMLGYSDVEEALKKIRLTTAVYVDEDSRKRFIAKLTRDGEIRNFETKLQLKNGASIPVSIHSRGTFKDGKLILLDSMVEDISERKQSEKALREAHDQLERRVEQRTRELQEANDRLLALDELKSAFLSAVSHDIRTPLTSVMGFAKLAARDFSKHFKPLSEEDPTLAAKSQRILNHLSTITEEGDRLGRMINDYLDLSRIESGRVEWHDTDISICDLVARALKVIQFVATEIPAVALKTDIPEGLPPVRADFDRLLQVLVNLLDNAAKFTTNGEIRVAAKYDGEKTIRITVSDTGQGIPIHDQPMIFDKFHKVDRADTLEGGRKGTGLGLAICKQIVEHYKGDIRVDSEPGRGSVFTITLPLNGRESG